MKHLILFILLACSVNTNTQETKVYYYEDKELITKPKPTKAFTDWIKKNNKWLGRIPRYGSRSTTKVTLGLRIDEEGKITGQYIRRGIGQGYDRKAFDLIENNPEVWVPGETKEGKVKTTVYYQIDFFKNDNSIIDENNKRVKGT